ncbi:MAG: VWA domain-containing protein, partial [Xanthomonadales bacterium]|nr:VWA domain-containing protein [Xanthomonadales bacterium]
MNALETFHFIRPGWLLLALPAALVIWAILRRQDPLRSWQAVIAPELLKHLVVRSEARRSRLRPALVLGFAWIFGIIAVSGPTWKKEPTPLTEDQSALFIVLKVTPDMLAQDIQPSRLQRSAQKIGELLALHPGSRTGLIAYAGSAHLVMPLTSDPEVIRFFAGELAPGVMPESGDVPVQAIALANRRLQASGLPGGIVLVADHVDREQSQELARLRAEGGADVHVYAMAAGPDVIVPAGSPPAPSLDRAGMAQVAKAGGGSLVVVSPDDRDVRQLAGQIERSIEAAPLREGERWFDFGYWLGLFF